MRTEEILKGIAALEDLLQNLVVLGKDAILFVAEKGLWEEFIGFHTKKELERSRK
jgi:hypothetical protein